MFDDRYDDDPVARMRAARVPREPQKLPARRGLWLEDTVTEFYGELVRADRNQVELRDADGAARRFPRDTIFLDDDGNAVQLDFTRPQPTAPARSASGSVYVKDAPARVARAGRIFVEGRHDAELVEKVWGHDLRVEGVAVIYLEGADHLEEVLREFQPSRHRRAGVLLDHLVHGSKESRIAAHIMQRFGTDAVRVVGHPYVDVWQALRPERLGLNEWPVIPRGQSWKHGICAALGWPHEDQADIARAWQHILGQVRNWHDLEPAVIGRVEELIDFVTEE
ncbi:DUF3097 family protein [Gulosibacter hominis]|uniref:DUF3097 family protein n=1 Tax=Gulosibacter hominis TaxID=2770504 RepID=UPI00191B23BE|nr:DUF3097 family protein [Gulosibacter hominis]